MLDGVELLCDFDRWGLRYRVMNGKTPEQQQYEANFRQMQTIAASIAARNSNFANGNFHPSYAPSNFNRGPPPFHSSYRGYGPDGQASFEAINPSYATGAGYHGPAVSPNYPVQFHGDAYNTSPPWPLQQNRFFDQSQAYNTNGGLENWTQTPSYRGVGTPVWNPAPAADEQMNAQPPAWSQITANHAYRGQPQPTMGNSVAAGMRTCGPSMSPPSSASLAAPPQLQSNIEESNTYAGNLDGPNVDTSNADISNHNDYNHGTLFDPGLLTPPSTGTDSSASSPALTVVPSATPSHYQPLEAIDGQTYPSPDSLLGYTDDIAESANIVSQDSILDNDIVGDTLRSNPDCADEFLDEELDEQHYDYLAAVGTGVVEVDVTNSTDDDYADLDFALETNLFDLQDFDFPVADMAASAFDDAYLGGQYAGQV